MGLRRLRIPELLSCAAVNVGVKLHGGVHMTRQADSQGFAALKASGICLPAEDEPVVWCCNGYLSALLCEAVCGMASY